MLQTDYELSYSDVQALSSRDALAAFLARLGYNTNDRLIQNVAAMNITSDTHRAAITHIERLASHDGRMFEVYLFELKSVTVAATQGIVCAFRNRPGDYLLVLVDSNERYERLDFVLVERYTADMSGTQGIVPDLPSPSQKQVGVRPRVLTVHRRNPDKVALRVLRRFSYTEPDTFAQYDKLLSAYAMADWSEQYFNNRALFSDYYLMERLPDSNEWKQAEKASATVQAFKKLRELYADVRNDFAGKPEAYVRTRLLEPALTALGFTFLSVKSAKGVTVAPDYRLFATTTNIATSVKPLALCLAYIWGRNLDGRDDQRDTLAPDENPGVAVVTLLDSGEADWAIVTNGKTWRLYAAKAHSRATNYYEIDLEEILVLPDADRQRAFFYFWLLFRADSFKPLEQTQQSEKRSVCFLDTLLSDSERYARELGERLKERVFDDIFPHFARGFVLHARRTEQLLAHIEDLSAEERNRLLEPYFNGALTFLYRLLFLLYAESRDLLPVREERGYYPKSLQRLKEQIAEKAASLSSEAPARIKTAYNSLSTALYDGLQGLFQAVDKGDAALNVPVYNGCLFMRDADPEDNSPEADGARFLATHKIPDRELALGLDRMARDLDDRTQALVFIDYKSLGVRQLGSIYEGLLEFKLRIAPEKMAYVKGKKTEEIVPFSEAQQKKLPILKDGRGKGAPDKTLAKGALYLENDRRERKATGSYYTPDYIVKYIVENTVGPVLKEKLETLRPAFREAEQRLKVERDKVKASKCKDVSPEHEAYKHYRETLNETFFDLRVLDPAMGSGHFLVEAVDYINDQLAKFLTAFKWNPIVHELGETRREIQKEMERQDVTIDMSKLTDLNLLKRQVLKRCIYGVDLNQMAVELAKVSLWLDCFTLGAPLSFLDHHMKCGNSLIGGSVEEVQQALSQNIWGNQFTYLLDATQLMRRVNERSDITASEVAESRREYRRAYDALAPFKRLLHVWLSEYFGNKGAKHTTRMYADAIVANDYSTANKEDREAIEAALKLADTRHFFHWELEFPEVFFGKAKRKENGGFDAVVGNPPYFSISTTLSPQEVAYISQAYINVYTGNSDIMYYFLSLAPKLLKSGCFQGMIVSRYFQEAKYAERVRTYLSQTTSLVHLVDFQNFQIFGKEVNTLSSIVVMQKPKNAQKEQVHVMRLRDDKIADDVLAEVLMHKDTSLFDSFNSISPAGGEVWNFKGLEDQSIFDKLVQCSLLLGDIAIVVQAMQTGINEILAPSIATLAKYSIEQELIHPIAKSGSISRFEFDQLQNAIIWTQGIDIDKYPNTKKYLLLFKNALAMRYDIKSRKANWWEISTSRNAELFFSDRPRILVPFMATGNKFCVDDEKRLNDGGDIRGIFFEVNCQYSEFYACAILNSRLCEYYHLRNTKLKRGGYYEYFESQLSALPIHRINFITPPKERAYYLKKAKNLYAYCMSKDDQACVLGFVEHHLSKQPEESDVVHDLLAFLAEEMIRLNKEKRAAMKEFLKWLVTTLKILPDKDGKKGIDVLTEKSKIADYPGDYQKREPALAWEELLDILRKNKSRLGVSLSDMGLVERVREQYEVSLGRVLPLKEQLRRTDGLIDRVVYRLYGLTEDEIKIVER